MKQFKMSNFNELFGYTLWIDALRYASNAGNSSNQSPL